MSELPNSIELTDFSAAKPDELTSDIHINERNSGSEKLKSAFTKLGKTIKAIVAKTSTISKNGAIGRDHLSNERTVLAYSRTSLGFLVLGIAIIQMSKYAIIQPISEVDVLSHSSSETLVTLLLQDLNVAKRYCRPLGGLCICAGLLTVLLGTVRYFYLQNMLQKSERFMSGSILILIIFFIMIPIFGLMFTMISRM
ncbi:hypothetical protein CANARDRAFT_56701 [[Candida] arabinofermentans NRRL YB-2248]|uniref:DUF202 domain-containing protein n=1 Tax=[Candida] arabinofermentans NRRL YB-2248 TaxID=983967 RepID=A0A1E4T8F9_9ASCO|nr:hypothetical protein CANARDRAFT_56701 [[Candida] arabinofermentans NRRL YB-2248]